MRQTNVSMLQAKFPAPLLKMTLAALCGLTLTACSDMDIPNLPGGSIATSSLQTGSFDSSLGNRLAGYAISNTSGGTGWCYQYVAQAVHAYVPAFLYGEHAWMAADQLAASPAFREISVAPSSLPALPAGAIVVWAKGSSPSGHISIADGKGNEISDHIARQMTSHYGGGGFRVFLPAGRG